MSISPFRAEARLKKSQESLATAQASLKSIGDVEGQIALRDLAEDEQGKMQLTVSIDQWQQKNGVTLADLPQHKAKVASEITKLEFIIQAQEEAVERDKASYPRLLKKHLRLCKRYGMADKMGRTMAKAEG
jgi:Ca2+-dependent lipid-binding protein